MTILDINNNSFYNKFEYNIENAVEALKKEFGQQFSISKSPESLNTLFLRKGDLVLDLWIQ